MRRSAQESILVFFDGNYTPSKNHKICPPDSISGRSNIYSKGISNSSLLPENVREGCHSCSPDRNVM